MLRVAGKGTVVVVGVCVCLCVHACRSWICCHGGRSDKAGCCTAFSPQLFSPCFKKVQSLTLLYLLIILFLTFTFWGKCCVMGGGAIPIQCLGTSGSHWVLSPFSRLGDAREPFILAVYENPYPIKTSHPSCFQHILRLCPFSSFHADPLFKSVSSTVFRWHIR